MARGRRIRIAMARGIRKGLSRGRAGLNVVGTREGMVPTRRGRRRGGASRY